MISACISKLFQKMITSLLINFKKKTSVQALAPGSLKSGATNTGSTCFTRPQFYKTIGDSEWQHNSPGQACWASGTQQPLLLCLLFSVKLTVSACPHYCDTPTLSWAWLQQNHHHHLSFHLPSLGSSRQTAKIKWKQSFRVHRFEIKFSVSLFQPCQIHSRVNPQSSVSQNRETTFGYCSSLAFFSNIRLSSNMGTIKWWYTSAKIFPTLSKNSEQRPHCLSNSTLPLKGRLWKVPFPLFFHSQLCYSCKTMAVK